MYVFGKINLSILVPVGDVSPTIGLLQANYKFNPERIVKWKLVAVDSSGKEEIIEVCDCNEIDLSETVD